jgi:gamma-glutamyl:cysteine ligase YbdK (ATP-grasp superfamily)
MGRISYNQFFKKQNNLYTGESGKVGIESELILKDRYSNTYVAEAHLVIQEIWRRYPDLKKQFDKEFWNGQLEMKTRPHGTVIGVVDEISYLFDLANSVALEMGYELVAQEWIPFEENLTEIVSPLDERYLAYAMANLLKLPAMCRVAGVHFHFGVSSFIEAINVHDRFACTMNDRIKQGWMNHERLKAFIEHICSENVFFPPEFKDERGFYNHLKEGGFLKKMATYYGGVRIHHCYPTVEDRICGATLCRTKLTSRIQELLEIGKIFLCGERRISACA